MATIELVKVHEVDDEELLRNIPEGLNEQERLDAAIDYLLEYGEWDKATVEVFGEHITIEDSLWISFQI